jgi:hypothetical protein
VQAAIKGHLYDWDTYKGKTCTLRVNLAQDGTLLSVKSEGGDPAFCQQCCCNQQMTKFLNRRLRLFMKHSKMRRWTSNLSYIFPVQTGKTRPVSHRVLVVLSI